MATPRKYVTVEEFEAIKAEIGSLRSSIGGQTATRPSVYVNPVEIADALSLTDADGVPVAVGDWL